MTKFEKKFHEEMKVCIELARQSIESGNAYASLLKLVIDSGGKLKKNDKKWIKKNKHLFKGYKIK